MSCEVEFTLPKHIMIYDKKNNNNKINVLSRDIAELIAAGEVIERPASVIKELVENSIDSGATFIDVEIKNGGTTYMKVSDNGCGIRKEDVPKAFLRHATSKISKVTDLDRIGTLGFRGEALASISAVSKVELTTRAEDEIVGTKCNISGPDEPILSDIGCEIGTTFVIKDLFYNIPARKKFLKKEITESNAIASIMDRVSLSHPEISFGFVKDGKKMLKTLGNKDLKSCIFSIYGKEFCDSLLPVGYDYQGINISGFTSKKEYVRPNRNMQHFFVNGRYVKTKTGYAALEEAYSGFIMSGKHPSCVLFIDIDASLVDVNVHPAKVEIKFANEKPIFDIVYRSVRNAIINNRSNVRYDFNELDKEIERNNFVRPVEKSIYNKNLDEIKPSYDGFNRTDISNKDKEPKVKASFQISSSKRDNSDTVLDEVMNRINNFQKQREQEENRIEKMKMEEKKIEEKRAEEKKIEEKKKEIKEFIRNYEEKYQDCREISPCAPDTGDDEIENSKLKEESDEPEIFVPKKLTVNMIKKEKIGLPKQEKFDNDCNIKEEKELETAKSQGKFIDDKDKPGRLLGEIFDTYVLLQKNEDLIIIDKHAFHERYIYDQLKAKNDKILSQIILTPIRVTLEKKEYSTIIENIDIMSEMGFGIEDSKAGYIIVKSIPTFVSIDDVSNLIIEIAGYIDDNKNNINADKIEWLYKNIACRAAIKAGKRSRDVELQDIIKKWNDNPNITNCPHGRPVCIVLSKKNIEKQFKRT